MPNSTFRPQEVHFPENGQTIIEMAHPFVVGASELVVYLNGILSVGGEDYVELTNRRIEFNFQLSEDDVVVTQHLVYFSDKIVKIITDTGGGLFQRYGTAIRLKNNQQYQATFRYGDKEMSFKFLTPIVPMYVTISLIRSDLGQFISKITDFQLAYMIYHNSIYASTIFEDYFEIDEDSGLGILTTTDGVVPYKVKQFVRYRTEVDLVTQLYLIMMGQSGSNHFTLGQLEVERRMNLGDYKPLLDSLKAELTKFSRTKSPVRSAVKGGSGSAYPLNTPRRDFIDIFAGGGGGA